MYTYILILYVVTLPFAKGDPVEVSMVAQKTLATCTAEGRRAESIFQGSGKVLRFSCVKAARGEV